MINYNELKPGKIILIDASPCEIVSTSGVVKKQRQKPHNTVKMRNLLSGNVVEKTFTQADKIEEAEMSTREVKYLYSNRGENWFCDPKNPKDRFEIDDDILSDKILYIKENDVIDAVVFDDEVVGLRLPIKMEIRVAEAPPNIKGNTASGGNKQVILETGLTVTTPLFIESGDIIRVNTETGEYSERVQS